MANVTMGEMGPWDVLLSTRGNDAVKTRVADALAGERDEQRRSGGARAPRRWRFTFDGWRMAEPESEYVLV